MLVGVTGNILVLLTKAKARRQFKCECWPPFLSLSISDLGCSLFIMSSSLLAILSHGQNSPWCETVSLLKFAFITSSLGSLAVMCVQRALGTDARGRWMMVAIAMACLVPWLTGAVFGIVPLVYDWIRYDSAEMLCTVYWESSYWDMLVYILCAFSICIFPPLLLLLSCSTLTYTGWIKNCGRDTEDLSSVTPLLVTCYLLCYTPYALSELILLGHEDLSPSPDWLRTLSSVTAFLDCCLNPFIYCSHQDFRLALLGLLWTHRPRLTEPVLTGFAKVEL